MKYYNSTVPKSPPQNITITSIDPASLKVSWQPPMESNNVPITGYVIQYIKDGSQDMIKDIKNINGTTHTISGLVPYTKYSVKVAAVNDDRTGPFSVPVVEISGEDGNLRTFACIILYIYTYSTYTYTVVTYVAYLCAERSKHLDTLPTIYVLHHFIIIQYVATPSLKISHFFYIQVIHQ